MKSPSCLLAVPALVLQLGCATAPAARVDAADAPRVDPAPRSARDAPGASRPAASVATSFAPVQGPPAMPPPPPPPSENRLGAEFQLYPAGAVLSADYFRSLDERSAVFARVGYNFTDRQDFGEHDDEEGGGPGVGGGYRRWIGESMRAWFWGARLDLWWLEIDWEDDVVGGLERSGTTDVFVVQPALEGGYSFGAGENGRLDLTATLGAEINAETDGEDVGEGAIFLIGLTWSAGL